MTDPRLDEIEKTLQEHGTAIYDLQESTRRLEAGQERQAVAIQELTSGFGRVLAELGKVGEEFRSGKKEMLAAMQNVSDHVIQLSAGQKAFKAEWKGVCDERHNHVNYRLKKVENGTAQAMKDLDDMSEQSKIHHIHNLEAELAKYEQEKMQANQEMRDLAKEKRAAVYKLIGLLITGLLTGTGGSLLIQWLLSR